MILLWSSLSHSCDVAKHNIALKFENILHFTQYILVSCHIILILIVFNSLEEILIKKTN